MERLFKKTKFTENSVKITHENFWQFW